MVFRVSFAIIAFFNLNINQMDIKIAFLYGFINQLIYIDILKSSKTKANWDIVCKVCKALYGLK